MARYALVVGIAQYDNFRNLDKAATDAAAIARLLQVHGQYQVQPLPKRLVAAENRWELATDKKLTGKDLGQALETFLLEQANGHEALIYFAGHGFEVPGLGRKKKGYLATSDCTSDGRNAVLFSDLNDLIRESSLSNLVVILDCCHAGSFLERTLLESTLTAFKEKKDYYLITACRSFERSREGEEHGVFTASVLKGLQAENADSEGTVTGDRLFDFVQRKLRQSGQEPIRTGTGRSITLVTYQPQVKAVTAIVDEHGEVICPYQGLQAFTAKQREFFFGRKRIVEAIKQKLEQQPFVPVIGASGSGKSSVVRAGLIPWLEESGWHILEPIKPGFETVAALRAVFEPFFKRSRSEIQTLHELIARDSTGLSSVIERLPGDNRYLLVVDQFEEMFTVCADEAERQRFIELITQIVEIQNSRLAIVTTMRADFLESCLHYPSLYQLIQSQAVFMPPLTGVDLRDVITEPAKHQGYTVEEALLLQILEDVGKEPGFLPLLEFALTKLWEKRDIDKHSLTLEQYEKLGGLTGALNLHAERVYCYRDYEAETPADERDEQEQEWIKRIFLRLVRTGEGERDTRQRQPKAKLLALAGDDSEAQEALRELLDGESSLSQGRLLFSGQEIHDSEPWVDLAHETLMDAWNQFAEWRQKDRELRRLISRLEDALLEWQKNPKNQNLMMGGLLAEVRENWRILEPELDIKSKEFYRYSDAQEQEQIATLEKSVKELEIVTQLKNDFVATVSHELRTPMANIRMATQMLEFKLKSLDIHADKLEAINRYLVILQQECQRETNLINDFLDFTRLDSNTEQLVLETKDLQSFIPSIVEPFIELTRNREQQFEIRISKELPSLTTDFSYLGRILTELITNAWKFTPAKEKIILSVRNNLNTLEIEISNSGVEIPAVEYNNIFDKFYRILNNNPWKDGGTGLGLALIQKLAKHLGGFILVKSQGGWTTFIVQLVIK